MPEVSEQQIVPPFQTPPHRIQRYTVFYIRPDNVVEKAVACDTGEEIADELGFCDWPDDWTVVIKPTTYVAEN